MHRSLFIPILLLFITAFKLSAQETGASELYPVITRFFEDENALKRKYRLVYSDEYYNRFTSLYESWKEEIDQLDFESLSVQGKVDFVLLRNKIESRSYFLGKDQEEFEKISFTLDGLDSLYEFVKTSSKGKSPNYQTLSASFSEISTLLEKRQEDLKSKPFDNWMEADKAKEAVLSWSENVSKAYKFYYGYDPEFNWWMEKPHTQLQGALKSYSEFLAKNYSSESLKDDGSGIIGKPLGKKAIREDLKFSFIPYSPEEMIEAAEEQFKYCESEMLKASAELGFGKDWKAAMEHVKNTYVPPGEQPQMIQDKAQQAIDFLEERDLITIPELSKETWRMEMMTAERQLINPFFTGGEVISISYPTHEMTHDQKMMSMRGNNPNFSHATVHHELIPGHHLQQYMRSRYKPYRQRFWTPFWVEGWALYWEINLWNKGFAETPEQRIGMLFWRMHRCARIIFSLSYHLEKMAPQECIDLLVDRVGHEYANAEAEVRRSFTAGYEPLYQIAYMIGGLQFFALQKEMIGLGWTEKQYHDAVLREGSIPVELLRVLLKKESIDKDYETQWKFSMDFR